MVLDLVKYIKNIKNCHKNMGNGAGGSAPPHPPVVPGPRLRRRISNAVAGDVASGKALHHSKTRGKRMDSTSCSQHAGARPPGSAEGQNGVVSCNDCAFQPSTARHSSAQVQLRKRSRDPMAAMPAMGLASWSQDDPKVRGLRGNKGLNCSCPLRFPLTLLPPHP